MPEAGAARETELVADCENPQRHLEMANSTTLEMARESEQLGRELLLEYDGGDGQLRDEIGALNSTQTPPTTSETLRHRAEYIA